MYRPMAPHDIARALTHVESNHPGRAFLEVALADQRIDWHAITRAGNGGLPALGHGQDADARYSLGGGRSLHTHFFARRGVARMHLDKVDPRRDAVGHLVTDTHIAHGAGVGGLLALAASATPWGILLGVVLGGAAGAAAEDPPKVVWHLRTWGWDGSIALDPHRLVPAWAQAYALRQSAR